MNTTKELLFRIHHSSRYSFAHQWHRTVRGSKLLSCTSLKGSPRSVLSYQQILVVSTRNYSSSSDQLLPSDNIDTPANRYDLDSVSTKVENLNPQATNAVDFPSTVIQTVETSEQVKKSGFFSSVLDFFQGILENFHQLLGTPWWISVICFSLGLRFILFPATVSMQKNSVLLQNMAAEQRKALAEQSKDVNEISGKLVMLQLKQLGKAILPGFALTSTFFTLRHMMGHPEFANGGILWFENLSQTDPYFILPCFLSSCLALHFELLNREAKLGKLMWLFRAFTPIIFLGTSIQPAAITLYLSASNFFTLVSSIFLRNKTVRQKLNIPPVVPMPNIPQDSWEDILKQARERRDLLIEQRIKENERKKI